MAEAGSADIPERCSQAVFDATCHLERDSDKGPAAPGRSAPAHIAGEESIVGEGCPPRNSDAAGERQGRDGAHQDRRHHQRRHIPRIARAPRALLRAAYQSFRPAGPEPTRTRSSRGGGRQRDRARRTAHRAEGAARPARDAHAQIRARVRNCRHGESRQVCLRAGREQTDGCNAAARAGRRVPA